MTEGFGLKIIYRNAILSGVEVSSRVKPEQDLSTSFVTNVPHFAQDDRGTHPPTTKCASRYKATAIMKV